MPKTLDTQHSCSPVKGGGEFQRFRTGIRLFTEIFSSTKSEERKYFPLPLAGEGRGEGGLLIFPLTSILSPEGRGGLKG